MDGTSLLNDGDFVVKAPPSANHRQLWFNTQLPAGGPWTDPRVRQAVGYCLDREQMVATLFEGQGLVANDHPIYPTPRFFDAGATPQRPRDKMANCPGRRGYPDGVSDTRSLAISARSPTPQSCVKAPSRYQPRGQRHPELDFGEFWCTAQLGAGQTGGPGVHVAPRPPASWTTAIVRFPTFTSPVRCRPTATGTPPTTPTLTDASRCRQGAVDVEGQKAAIGQIQQKLTRTAGHARTSTTTSAGDSSVSGVEVTLGHIQLQGHQGLIL